MKRIFIILLFIPFLANATNYYFSSSTGNDANSCTIGSPCATLLKASNISYNPGDSVLFKAGDTFYGNLSVVHAGNSSSQIYYGSYGAGANAIISQDTTLASWTSIGGNVYAAYCPSSASVTPNTVLLDGVKQVRGRYPNYNSTNGGFLTTTSNTLSQIILATPLDTNWLGANMVVKCNSYDIDYKLITNVKSNDTFTLASNLLALPPSGYGVFITNSLMTLDLLGEWYWSSGGDSLYMCFPGTTPGAHTIKMAYRDSAVDLNTSYITIAHLNFQGTNKYGVSQVASTGTHDSVLYCQFNNVGWDAIYITNIQSQCGYVGNNIQNSGDVGIWGYPGYWDSTSFRYDTIQYTGLYAGMGPNLGFPHYSATEFTGNSDTIQHCYITNAGNDGLTMTSGGLNGICGNWLVTYNFIDSVMLIAYDGACIYSPFQTGNNSLMDHNICLNAVGNYFGTTQTNNVSASGIYLDNGAKHWTCTNNTSAYCTRGGLFMHNVDTCYFNYNTIFSCNAGGIYFQEDAGNAMRADTLLYNTVVQPDSVSTTYPYPVYYQTVSTNNDLGLYGQSDYNYLMRPVRDFSTIEAIDPTTKLYTLPQWQHVAVQDLHSLTSPIVIFSNSQIFFTYNASANTQSFTVPWAGYTPSGTFYPLNSTVMMPQSTSFILLESSQQSPCGKCELPNRWNANKH